MRNFIVSFRKNATSLGFWLCVGMTVLLLFAAEVYYDYGTQSRYSVFRALTDFSREELANHIELCSANVVQNARSGWFTLFAPIIAAFCFVPIICAEREEKAARFQIFRTTKLKYSISQFFSGVVSGGIAISLGYIIFAIFVIILFPNMKIISEFPEDLMQDISQILLPLTLKVFVFGAFWSVPAMFLTSVLRNKYLILCIPFFLKYGLNQLHQKISESVFLSSEINQNSINIVNAINPEGILWVYDETMLTTALVFGISTILLFTAFVVIEQKRGDCGA